MRKASISIILLFALFLACTLAAGCNKQPPAAEPKNHDNNQVTQEASTPIEKDNSQTLPPVLAVYQITQKDCALKAEPRDDADILVNLDIGMPVNVIEQHPDGWFKVVIKRVFSDYEVTGYINKESLQPARLHEGEYWPSEGLNEEEIIANNSESVKRDGDTLTLKLRNGEELNLTDQPGMEGFRYFLEDCQEKYFLIYKENNVEGFSFYLFSRENGNKIDNLPTDYDLILFSPDGKRIVFAAPYGYIFYGQRMLLVYNIEHEEPVEFELRNAYWSATDLNWVNNNEIEFTKNYYNGSLALDENPDHTGFVYWKDSLILDNGKWTFRDTQSSSLLPVELIQKAEQKGITTDQLELLIRLNYSQEDILNLSLNKVNEIIENKEYNKDED